ncbi:hypothetical protein SUNI508_07197 [Seiridium unicorne]|uniref:Uncharacterized protein n=1 Tax=Seiridium unicorne TaxID=138068 RepID=A0ABR2UZN6_9PEZI
MTRPLATKLAGKEEYSGTSQDGNRSCDIEAAVANDEKRHDAKVLGEKPRQDMSAAEEDEAGKYYPPPSQVAVVMVGLYLSLFMLSLDRTIISTAIPAITNESHSLDDIGWSASVYMMTGCAFQLFFGRVYTFYPPKWVFIAAIYCLRSALKYVIAKLDLIDIAIFIPTVVCLLLALQWGGATYMYAWNDAHIRVLWILFGLLSIGFVVGQIWNGEDATIPPRIIKYHSVTASTLFAFFISASMTTLIFWLPTWFQAI